MIYIKFFFCSGAFRYCVCNYLCWHVSHRDVLHWMHTSLVKFCLTFRSFWLWLTVFVTMICLNDVFFCKAITVVALIAFPNVLLIFNIYQCSLIIYLIFGKVELCYGKWNYVFLYCINFIQISENDFFGNWIAMNVLICYREELKKIFLKSYQVCLTYTEKSVRYT